MPTSTSIRSCLLSVLSTFLVVSFTLPDSFPVFCALLTSVVSTYARVSSSHIPLNSLFLESYSQFISSKTFEWPPSSQSIPYQSLFAFSRARFTLQWILPMHDCQGRLQLLRHLSVAAPKPPDYRLSDYRTFDSRSQCLRKNAGTQSLPDEASVSPPWST